MAVLASGGGTNLQSVIDSVETGNLNCKIEMVIRSKEGILASKRAEEKGIKTYVVSKKGYRDTTYGRVLGLTKGKVDLIVLAGYFSILQGDTLKGFKDKVVNMHPSLIPGFCGPGVYGLKVHKAAINSGVGYSGCIVHFVNREVDGGAIVLQEVVPVYFEGAKGVLQKRILEKGRGVLPKVIDLISKNKVEIIDGKVRIK